MRRCSGGDARITGYSARKSKKRGLIRNLINPLVHAGRLATAAPGEPGDIDQSSHKQERQKEPAADLKSFDLGGIGKDGCAAHTDDAGADSVSAVATHVDRSGRPGAVRHP